MADRQSLTGQTVDRRIRRRLQGANLQERVLDGLEVFGIKKAELSRRVFPDKDPRVAWRRIHAWTTGENAPTTDNLRALAAGFPVTVEELLGVAAGQDPPFEAWPRFLAALAEEGDELTPEERAALQSILWPSPPTVRQYQMVLGALRSGSGPRV